jgi:hypothetical protein
MDLKLKQGITAFLGNGPVIINLKLTTLYFLATESYRS